MKFYKGKDGLMLVLQGDENPSSESEVLKDECSMCRSNKEIKVAVTVKGERKVLVCFGCFKSLKLKW